MYEYGVARESMSVGSKVNYYGYDGRGNVSELMNAIGGVNMSYSYGAFGKTSTKVTTYTKNSYTYNGENVDLIPGVPDLQYLRARYYDPNMGRFMQQDTLFGEMERPLTQNLYIYCLNNGVNLRDPSGNSSIAELQAQYDRAQRAGAGQSVLDEIKKAIESKRSSSSGSAPTQAQAQEAARKAEEAKRKAREAAAKAAAAGVTGTQLDQMLAQGNISPPPTWGSGSGNPSSNLNGGYNGTINGETIEERQKRLQHELELSKKEAKKANNALKFWEYVGLFTKNTANVFTLGSYGRGETFANNPSLYNGANSLTFGLVETTNRTFNNPDPFSLDHWVNSAVLAGVVAGGLTQLPKPKPNPASGIGLIDDVGGVTADSIQFSDKFSGGKYSSQVIDRGWNNDTIASTINNPAKIGVSYNKYTGNSSTVYYIDDMHNVVVDNITGKIIQISDRTKPIWKN